MKKIIALVLVAVMMMAMGSVAFAESYGITNPHTITINSNGTGAHSYEVYQVFKGNLDAAEGVLSDIDWGTGVDGAGLLNALKADTFANKADFTSCTTPADVAKVLAGYGDNSAKLDAFAAEVSKNLTTTKATGDKGTAISVNGDGYYFVKDVTSTEILADGDTLSKFMLQIVKDITVTAKDTVFSPDKKIRKANGENFDRVAADSSAIGDTVTFDVEVVIPDTTKYIDHFIMNMIDTLPSGLTYTNAVEVTANGSAVPAENYTVTVAEKPATGEELTFATYTVPSKPIEAAGGQTIKVVFKNFKSYVETNNLVGKKLVVKYTAVVNDDAAFGPTGNENEVKYVYSNDPNHDYDGDEPGDQDPTGDTPTSKTKTVVTALQINKVDGTNSNTPLAGAEFTVEGTAYNTTLVTGEEFVKAEDGTYWKLLDGSYTDQDPKSEGMNTTQYDSTTIKYKKQAVNKVVTVPTEAKIVGITDSNGVLNISGLKPGTYTITETHAPDGYNKIDESKVLEITWDATNGFGLTEASTTAGFSMTGNGVLYEITIVNNQGSTLPSTGGIGTTIFYILGGLLVIGAGVVLVSRRRMSVEK